MTYEFEFQKGEFIRAGRAAHRHAIRNRLMRRAFQVGLLALGTMAVINIIADFDRDTGFRASSFQGAVELPWRTIRQVVETPEFVLFYVTGRLAHYLPKRVVTSSDLPTLRALLGAKVAHGHVHLLESA